MAVLPSRRKRPNMQTIFSDDEVVYFSDMGDLKEKLLYYAAHPEEAALIA
jgi:spore maturation protein CgeB